jgi:superfamily II DNA or RNA helicase/HKD family nuclease
MHSTDISEKIMAGCETAYIDKNNTSNLAYKPQFISNNYQERRKVLSSIESELGKCDYFFISVAFITMSGLNPLLLILKELEKKNIPGKVLTTDYLHFSEPRALKKIAELKNIDLKMYCTEGKGEGFHTKGYIFKKDQIYRIIIGSSNITIGALTRSKEWNTKILSTEQGEYADDVVKEFNHLWDSKKAVYYANCIDNYTVNYDIIKRQKLIAKDREVPSISQYRLQPNQMQVDFVSNLKQILAVQKNKALLISSTGTGKTYASAFALRDIEAKKALFLVHREQIAKQAIKSFKNVFDDTCKMGLLSGNSKETKVDFLFATMNMMAKKEVREEFNPEEFEVIIIDEAHRIGAQSYQNIMAYFKPNLWLGMTASPERMDGFDVFSAFDHNIAYEIRLEQALKEDLLCPFNYFGITDIEVDGKSIDDETGVNNFMLLTSDQRVDHVIEKAEYFGYSGERVKGLIFCSTKKEAVELSNKFNLRRYQTMALTGEHSQQQREDAIERLVSDNLNNKLDYIFTVDIFNEGVDIPEVNQIIMLRPTQSPIIFVQQLGRGLRKADNKEFVVILDFIANYKNNFMIPIALSGDRSYNKDTIRNYIAEGNRIIPGSSTIHFDEITRKRIFESIDVTNFNDIRFIKDSYMNLKYKLGRIPSLEDFDKYGEIDVLRIFSNSSLGSYYSFLVKYEKDYEVRISERAQKYLELICRKFAAGKRIHELKLLDSIITIKYRLFEDLQVQLRSNYNINITDITKKNLVNVLTNEFTSGTGKSTYRECVFIEPAKDDFNASKEFLSELSDINFYYMVKEVVDFGMSRYNRDYADRYMDTSFHLYSKYTYEEVCRLLEWEKEEVAQNISGYKFNAPTMTYPVFINYDKSENIQDTIKYEDRFINNSTLIAISKAGRKLSSRDVKTALQAEELGIQMELFVRKNKDDIGSKEFYYLGKIKPTGEAKEFVMTNTTKTAVEICYKLVTPVRDDIYDYIVG